MYTKKKKKSLNIKLRHKISSVIICIKEPIKTLQKKIKDMERKQPPKTKQEKKNKIKSRN